MFKTGSIGFSPEQPSSDGQTSSSDKSTGKVEEKDISQRKGMDWLLNTEITEENILALIDFIELMKKCTETEQKGQ